MDRIIYTSMTGATAALARQAVLANNLANVSTTGFRAELSTYRAVPVQGEGASTRVMAADATSGYSDAPGPALRTDRHLDAIASGSSWFAVQSLDGSEAYTRNGHFEIAPDGTLVSSSGLPVLSSDGGPISVPAGATVTMGRDGTLSAKIGSQPGATIGKLKLATPSSDDPLVRGTDGLFRTTSGDPMAQDTTASLTAGELEGSNVNPIDAMVGMIQTARQFEAQMKLLQSAEANDKSSAQLLGVQ